MKRQLELRSWEAAGNKHVSLSRPGIRAHHAVISEVVQRYCAPHDSVLDFGCGAGQLSEEIARRSPSARLTVADPYEVCLRLTLDRVPSATPVRVAEEHIDVDAFHHSFNVVVVSHVLEHTHNPTEALKALLGLVSPGGYCVVAVPNPARPKVLWYGLRQHNYVNKGHVQAWDPAHFHNFIEEVVGATAVEYLGDEVQLFPDWMVNRVAALRFVQRRLAQVVPWWAFSNIAVLKG